MNTSRGKVVSVHDLVVAMQSGKIKGCGLDVIESENYNQNNEVTAELKADIDTLYGMQNTVFTPHVAGWSRESYFKLADVLADKIISVLG